MSNNKQNHIGEANKKVSSIELIIAEIDNELSVIENLYGSEIIGRKIGLAFSKRIALQFKKQEQNINPIKFSEWLNYIKTENKKRYMTSLTLTTTKN